MAVIDGIKRFAKNFQYLSDYAQKCLTVENEDKPNGYDIEHTLELAKRIPTRTCLDIHHYACHRMKNNEKVKNSDGKVVNRKIRDEFMSYIKSYFEHFVVSQFKVSSESPPRLFCC